MRLALLAPLGFAVSLGACGGQTGPQSASSPARDPNVAALEEIRDAESQNISNVYDFVSSRHSNWMRARMTGLRGQISTPTVYLDNTRMGDLTAMRSIPLSSVTRIRYLAPSEAQGEFGINNLGGAIAVSTR